MPYAIEEARTGRQRPGCLKGLAGLKGYLAAGSAAMLCLLLAACAGNSAVLSDIRYDFGPAPAAPVSSTLPTVKVLDVGAPSTIDTDRLLYRLSYANAQRTGAYADTHWTMSPARLLTQRLRNTLSSHGTVLTGGDGVRAPVLKVELEQFEQVFDSETESSGVVAARATLFQAGKVLSQRTFIARAPASSPDASGGARALAAASDDLVAQIGAWLGVQALLANQ